MSKIYFLRLNLDLLGDELAMLETDQERSDWLLGFRVGAIGGGPRDAWSEARRAGWSFGVAAHEEALEAAEKFARAGKASAEARRSKHGSAQPSRTTFERRSNTVPNAVQNIVLTPVRTPLEQDSEQSVEHLPNQPTTNNQQPITNNQQPPPPNPPRGKRVVVTPGMFDEMIPPALATTEFVETWHKWIEARKGQRKPITELAAKEQLETLAGFGLADAIRSIKQSIANDWQGLFPPKTNGLPSTRPPRPGTPQWNGFDRNNYTIPPKGPNGEIIL